MRGTIHDAACGRATAGISTHAPHVGSDQGAAGVAGQVEISTRAPHAGSDRQRDIGCAERLISTHAPHAGSDRISLFRTKTRPYFNSRSPCGERFCSTGWIFRTWYFNSRSPCGERFHAGYGGPYGSHFISRSPCGERYASWSLRFHQAHFNSRSPCGERYKRAQDVGAETQFQLTLPMRGAIELGSQGSGSGFISTHAPHAGSDRLADSTRPSRRNFNSRSPCGERFP